MPNSSNIILRSGISRPLTYEEVDGNFSELINVIDLYNDFYNNEFVPSRDAFEASGWGVSQSSLISDIDDSSALTGHYITDNTTVGDFPSGVSKDGALIVKSTPNGTIQNYSSENRKFERTFSGTWGGWNEDYTTFNLTPADLTQNNVFQGDVTVQGDLFVQGEKIQVDAEFVTADTVITLNDGEPGPGVTAGFSGIEIDRGSLPNYEFGFNESTESFELGETGNRQPVATRESSPVINGVAVWNNTLNRFDTISATNFKDTYLGLATVATSGSYNDLSGLPSLGNVSDRTVTTSWADSTNGRVPILRDTGGIWGLGSSTLVPVNDFTNGFSRTQFVAGTNTATDKPTLNWPHGAHFRFSSSVETTLLFGNGSAGGRGMAFRSRIDGTSGYEDWRYVWDSANLIKVANNGDSTPDRFLVTGSGGLLGDALSIDLSLSTGSSMLFSSNTNGPIGATAIRGVKVKGSGSNASYFGARNGRFFWRTPSDAGTDGWYEGWGTNNLTKVTSNVDTVDGNVLTVGYGAIYQTSALSHRNSTSLNLRTRFSLEQSIGAANRPTWTGPSTIQGIFTLPIAADRGLQIQFSPGDAAGTNRVNLRTYTGGVFADWVDLWTETNLVKTTSPVDRTSGSVMQVGTGGVNGPALNVAWDSPTFIGGCFNNANIAGPISTTTNVYGIRIGVDADRSYNLGMRHGRLFWQTRGDNTGTTDWYEAWGTNNLVKTTSSTDTTAGRMLQVGHMGLGGAAPIVTGLNGIGGNRFVSGGNSISNRPAGVSWLVGLNLSRLSGNGETGQIVIGTASNSGLHYRAQYSADPQEYFPWRTVWDTGNTSSDVRGLLASSDRENMRTAIGLSSSSDLIITGLGGDLIQQDNAADVRSLLGLTVVESDNDITPGRVLVAGYASLLQTSALSHRPSVNLNSRIQFSLEQAQGETNRPGWVGVSTNHGVLTLPIVNNRGMQIAYSPADTANRVSLRTYTGGTYASWVDLYTTGNTSADVQTMLGAANNTEIRTAIGADNTNYRNILAGTTTIDQNGVYYKNSVVTSDTMQVTGTASNFEVVNTTTDPITLTRPDSSVNAFRTGISGFVSWPIIVPPFSSMSFVKSFNTGYRIQETFESLRIQKFNITGNVTSWTDFGGVGDVIANPIQANRLVDSKTGIEQITVEGMFHKVDDIPAVANIGTLPAILRPINVASGAAYTTITSGGNTSQLKVAIATDGIIYISQTGTPSNTIYRFSITYNRNIGS